MRRGKTAKSLRPKQKVPIWRKYTLTIQEAAAYSGIGEKRLRSISNEEDCVFVLWVGKKRMFKRKLLDEFIAQAYSL